MAGGDIIIRSLVRGDTRIAGGNISVENSGSGDLMIAGGSIRISKDVQVGKDLGVAGSRIVIDGTVK